MKNAFLARQFGALIRELRLEAQLSQEEFADRCELHRTYIGSIERGEKTITIETAYKIAKALGMPLSYIFQRLESSIEERHNIRHDHK
jgi:transcriptional regulator with XRE-family HTH domain